MIEIIELHAASAHFPIALLISSVFFDIAGRVWKKPELETTSYWTHLLGIVSSVVTLALGSLGNPFLEDVGFLGNPWHDYGHAMTQKAVQHSWVGIAAIVFFASLALWRIRRKNQFSKNEWTVYLLISGVGVALLGLAGYLGSHVMD